MFLILLLLTNVLHTNGGHHKVLIEIDEYKEYIHIIDVAYQENAIYSVELDLNQNSNTAVNYSIFFNDDIQKIRYPTDNFEQTVTEKGDNYVSGTLFPGNNTRAEIEVTVCLADTAKITYVSLFPEENKSAQVEINIDVLDEGTRCWGGHFGFPVNFQMNFVPIALMIIISTIIRSNRKFN
jgi:hypothetical protein